MRGYHAIASMLCVDKADNCVWLDERDTPAQEIHMTPAQATAAGEALLEVGGSPSGSMFLPVTARAEVIDMSRQGCCTGCRKLMLKDEMVSGKCNVCLSPPNEMAMAASIDEIVGEVVAGLMDKWRLDKAQKRRLEDLSQARDKIQPPVEVYSAISDRTVKNKLQAAVTLIGKHIEHAEKAVRAKDERAAEMSRGLARKKLMGLVETLAPQRQLSGYTNGLTEAHRLLAVA